MQTLSGTPSRRCLFVLTSLSWTAVSLIDAVVAADFADTSCLALSGIADRCEAVHDQQKPRASALLQMAASISRIKLEQSTSAVTGPSSVSLHDTPLIYTRSVGPQLLHQVSQHVPIDATISPPRPASATTIPPTTEALRSLVGENGSIAVVAADANAKGASEQSEIQRSENSKNETSEHDSSGYHVDKNSSSGDVLKKRQILMDATGLDASDDDGSRRSVGARKEFDRKSFDKKESKKQKEGKETSDVGFRSELYFLISVAVPILCLLLCTSFKDDSLGKHEHIDESDFWGAQGSVGVSTR